MNKRDLPNYRKADGEQRCGNCRLARNLDHGIGCARLRKWVGNNYDVRMTYGVISANKVCDLWEEEQCLTP